MKRRNFEVHSEADFLLLSSVTPGAAVEPVLPDLARSHLGGEREAVVLAVLLEWEACIVTLIYRATITHRLQKYTVHILYRYTFRIIEWVGVSRHLHCQVSPGVNCKSSTYFLELA